MEVRDDRNRNAPTAAPASPPLRRSYAEWLAWERDGLSEWVGGEVIVYSAPANEHQQIVGFFSGLLGLFVQIFQLGIVRVAPFSMRILPGGPAREPDLFFLAQEHRARRTQRALEGPADLIIEVISGESVACDRADKLSGRRRARILDHQPACR